MTAHDGIYNFHHSTHGAKYGAWEVLVPIENRISNELLVAVEKYPHHAPAIERGGFRVYKWHEEFLYAVWRDFEDDWWIIRCNAVLAYNLEMWPSRVETIHEIVTKSFERFATPGSFKTFREMWERTATETIVGVRFTLPNGCYVVVRWGSEGCYSNVADRKWLRNEPMTFMGFVKYPDGTPVARDNKYECSMNWATLAKIEEAIIEASRHPTDPWVFFHGLALVAEYVTPEEDM